MVDNSDGTIAVWDEQPSGTANTVEYTQKQGKPALIIDPEKKVEGWLKG